MGSGVSPIGDSPASIDNASVGTVFKGYGGLTKQSSYSGYHGVHSANTLNDKLRAEGALSDNQQKIVDVMDSKMETVKSTIKADREVSVKTLKSMGLNVNSVDDLQSLEGTTFTDKGYASASYSPYEIGTAYYTMTSKPIHMRIRAPKGSKAYLTSNSNEHEITFGRNQKYKIEKVHEVHRVDRFGKTRTSIRMDVSII